MKLGKYSFGLGDRFGHQGLAQLSALIKAKEAGVDITPVWNKSFREHQIIYTTQDSVRKEADEAVRALGWSGSYFVDADHVNLNNVDGFIEASDFFTLDVADFIGEKSEDAAVQSFVDSQSRLTGTLRIPGIDDPIKITEPLIRSITEKYLFAVQKAGETYRYIVQKKGNADFVPEVSMDETDAPQTPVELLFILAMIAEEHIPVQTIAPKFTGRFNKGVDYVGDIGRFASEFEDDVAVLRYAAAAFGLPKELKLSVHSGSDKFAIYTRIRNALKKFDAGVHVKTAGTTWLEELIGLAESGGDGLRVAKQIYASAYGRFDELCRPYATVIDIHRESLPAPEIVDAWGGPAYAAALRHDPDNSDYNPHFRQLLHVGYKVAAEMGDVFLNALKAHKAEITKHVTENLWGRHIKRLFL